jgi:putative hemolysin
MRKIIAGIIFILAICLAGCQNKPADDTNADNTQIANPASVFCTENGGKLEIANEEGGQRGICTLKDGTKCDEWAYFRGECPKKCGECPQYVAPSPDFCKDGNIILPVEDECGCMGHPGCEQRACTAEAKVCADGTTVGRVLPDCKFAPCPEQEQHRCTPESRNAKICTMDYVPVCGWFGPNIKCFKAPCAITESNGCTACINPNVEYWTTGACPK